MQRPGDFSYKTIKEAYLRQGGVCAYCGMKIIPPWPHSMDPNNWYAGNAHHLRPLHWGGNTGLDNCVYLCEVHHQFLGHGMAPLGIDNQGGSSKAWIMLSRSDFKYWEKKKKR